MSAAPFPFAVGDKVRLARWDRGEYVTITAIGVRHFLALNEIGGESIYQFRTNWFRYAAAEAAA